MKQKQQLQHPPELHIQTTAPLLTRGMTLEEAKTMCTNPIIPIREMLFFRMIYESLLRPFEVLNLQIENWDRKQALITARKVKTKTQPKKGDRHKKEYLPTPPKTRAISPATNELLREHVSNRKKGHIFVNKGGERLTLEWFNQAANHYATRLGIQRTKKYYVDGRELKLITCMALREAGERHHDNAGGSRKLSAEGADHTMQVKEKHYEKVGQDVEQISKSMRKYHPAWGW